MIELDDQRVRETIVSEISNSFFIQAGAGSGKTQLVVERILNILLTGDATIDEIIAITFTENAAYELKQRIYAKLEDLELNSNLRGDEKNRIKRAKASFHEAIFTTIHGLANKILLYDPLCAGLPLSFVILTDIKRLIVEKQNFDRAINRIFADASSRAIFKLAASIGLTEDHLRKISAKIQARWHEYENINLKFSRKDLDNQLTDFRKSLATNLETLDKAIEESGVKDENDKALLTINNLVEPIKLLNSANRDISELLVVLAQFEERSTERLGRKTNFDNIENLRGCIKTFQQCLLEKISNIKATILSLVFKELAEKTIELLKENHRQGLFSFDDLLVIAYKSLTDNNNKPYYYNFLKFTHLIVDEFQDTDPLQFKIVEALKNLREEKIKKEGVGKPLKLVFVGDPHQSIYSFRNADIKTFEQAKTACVNGQFSLNKNFRSKATIVGFANKIYTALIESLLGAQETPSNGFHSSNFENLVAARPDSNEDLIAVQIIDDCSSEVVEGVRNLEASFCANEIFRLVNNEKLDYRDIAVLIKTRSSLHFLLPSLRKRNIPFELKTASLIYSTPEISELINIFKACTYPEDEKALIAALKSSFLAVSDDDLLMFRQNNKTFSYLLEPSDETPDTIKTAFKELKLLYEQTNSLSVPDSLQMVVARLKIRLISMAYANFAGIWKNIELALNDAYSWCVEPTITKDSYFNFIDALVEEDTFTNQTASEDSGVNAVKIYTIHGAKGLEFPVVFLLGMGQQSSSHPISIGKANTVPEILINKNLKTKNADTLNDMQKANSEFEMLRLFYVGITRAKERLYISAIRKQDDESALTHKLIRAIQDKSSEFCEIAKVVQLKHNKDAKNGQQDSSSRNNPDTEQTMESDILESITKNINYTDEKLQVVETTRLASLLSSAEDNKGIPNLLAKTSQPNDFAQPSLLDLGKAIHEVLEFANFKQNLDDNQLTALVKTVAQRFRLTSSVNNLKDLAREALSSSDLKHLVENARVLKEYPVYYKLDNNLVLIGVLDLLLIKDNEIIILDYKSTSLDLESFEKSELYKKYQIQLAIYKFLVKALMKANLPIKTCLFMISNNNCKLIWVENDHSNIDKDSLNQSAKSALAKL